MTAHYLYRCFEADGRLAYVGITVDPATRFDTHTHSSWWAPRVARVAVKVLPSLDAARQAELHAIRTEHPRWNVTGRTPGFQWTPDMWRDLHTAMSQLPGNPVGRAARLARIASRFAVRFGESIEVAA